MTSLSRARTCASHRPAGARHDRRVPSVGAVDQVAASLATLDATLASPMPLDFLGSVSRLLSPLEPAARGTAETMAHAASSRALTAMLLTSDTPVTTAALHLVREMAADDELRRRCADELAQRRTPVPAWVRRFHEIRVDGPVRVLLPPADGVESLVIGASLPGVDLAEVSTSLAGLGLDPADLARLAEHDDGPEGPQLPTLPSFDAFTLVLTTHELDCGRLPSVVLLTQHEPADLVERLCAMDDSVVSRTLPDAEARRALDHVLGGTDQCVPLDDTSAGHLPLLRCLAERLTPELRAA